MYSALEVPLTHKQRSLFSDSQATQRVVSFPYCFLTPIIGKHLTIPEFQKWRSLLFCALSRHKDLGLSWDAFQTSEPQQYEHWRCQERLKRLWWVGEAGTGLRKEGGRGEFETFLRSLLLSSVGVYASGNKQQCGGAADWLESDRCLCWPERLLVWTLAPVPVKHTQALATFTCTFDSWHWPLQEQKPVYTQLYKLVLEYLRSDVHMNKSRIRLCLQSVMIILLVALLMVATCDLM